ncbi:MAG: pyridinium-3,5-bisthiocarboxylic acid mononucleotide nickel chelatase [Verrucomicrobiota bacterium]
MKILYLDLFSGISGDMFLGALLDLGVDFRSLEAGLEKLGLEGDYHLHASRQQRGAIAGMKFDVHLEHAHEASVPGHDHEQGHVHSHDTGHQHGGEKPHAHHHEPEHDHAHEHAHDSESRHGRTFGDIRELISRSPLGEWVKTKSIAIFQRVADAEGKIHGHPPADVHFHEVGAIDSILDIVGACIALDLLGRPRVLASAVVEGTGWVKCAHGRFPVPTPATLEILGARGVSISQCEEPFELVTPTGAAIVAELAESFGGMRDLTPEKIGYGLGTRENKTRPNVLRAVLGVSGAASVHDWESDTICILQTNLDDMNAELLGGFVDKALASGALDVFHTPIQMKKSRPGVLLTVLCAEQDGDKFAALMLRETTAFGVRRQTAGRRKLRREIIEVSTPFGPAKIKLGRLDGQVVQAAPEFESCRETALRSNVSIKQIYEAAIRALK